MADYVAPNLIGPSSPERAGRPITLAASRCRDCGRVDFPSQASCSGCGGSTDGVELMGPASLGARTAVLHPPPGGLVPVPYEVGVAQFPEGISILGPLVDGEGARRGDALETIAVAVDDRLTYGFRPVSRHTGGA